MKFSSEQIEHLQGPLMSDRVSTRQQGGRNLSYIEGWWAIAEANRIFGFDAWNRETIDVKCVCEKPRQIGKGQYAKDGYGVTYTAKVRVTVGDVVREGCGTGHGIDADCGQAHESAIKEAETDAMKRALMTFGNPFGLALYDKTQSNVADPSAMDIAPDAKPKSKADSRPVYDNLAKQARAFTSLDNLDQWWKQVSHDSSLPTDWVRLLFIEFITRGLCIAPSPADASAFKRAYAKHLERLTPDELQGIDDAVQMGNSQAA